ncbi:oxygen-independent coproporphyrinogen III oxidase [Albibacterium profundi]|uniref:Coproporphyrinogen-III oxidase n=1 Tax=Albibacterium profundi TaxID=3134906 RepID=A0ABV5CAH3_9SPHI
MHQTDYHEPSSSKKSSALKNLVSKYNIAAPRYTSYPTVPYWDIENWDKNRWIDRVKMTHEKSSNEGISLYIHLPFCESLCTYCGCNTRITKNHGVEMPYLMDVLKEWELYKSHLGANILISDIHLGGGTPTFFSPENLKFLIENLLEDCRIGKNSEFSFEAHPANTTVEHLQTLYDLGFKRLSLGIQDFDPLIQFLINRKQTEAEVDYVVKEARKIGYTSINFDLIYGLPKQSLKTIRDTIEKVVNLKPDRISYYSYAHVPWLRPGQRHYNENDLPKNEEKLQLYELGKEIISRAGYKDVGMDHFAIATDSLYLASRNGKLHRNFMGYTDRYSQLMIGLGVSSISDSWHAFAQNVKKNEEYHRLLAENKLPLMKGHIHTEVDLMLRKHILDIMCTGATNWNHSIYSDYRTIISKIEEELLSLKNDGLINISDYGIEVTELGHSFLRNICMAFDKRLHDNSPTKELFSRAI